MKQDDVDRVQGKGKRKHPLQRLEEELESSLERVQRYHETISICGPDRNSYAKTDPDATFMRMKDDHMRNGQLRPAYNLNIAVNSEFIVGMDLSQDRTDYHCVSPLLDELEAIFGKPVGSVVLDSGYDSEDNFHYCHKKGIAVYIKPQYYESQKKKAYFKNPKNWRSMNYDEASDTFHCLGGRTLRFLGTANETTSKGLECVKHIYECEDCGGCELKGKCTAAKGNRQVHWNKRLSQWRKESEERIQSEHGILLRLNRSIQAEGGFGTLKSNRGWTRLRHYGMDKCKSEVLWEVMGYNLLKLTRKVKRKDPFQHLLIPEKVAS